MHEENQPLTDDWATDDMIWYDPDWSPDDDGMEFEDAYDDLNRFNDIWEYLGKNAESAQEYESNKFATENDTDEFVTENNSDEFARENDNSEFSRENDTNEFATAHNTGEFSTENDNDEFVTENDIDEFVIESDSDNYAIENNTDEFVTENDSDEFAMTKNINEFATEKDTNEFDELITKNETEEYVTENDSKEYATENDSKEYATENDTDEFVTGNDTIEYATENDIDELVIENNNGEFVTENDFDAFVTENDTSEFVAENHIDETARGNLFGELATKYKVDQYTDEFNTENVTNEISTPSTEVEMPETTGSMEAAKEVADAIFAHFIDYGAEVLQMFSNGATYLMEVTLEVAFVLDVPYSVSHFIQSVYESELMVIVREEINEPIWSLFQEVYHSCMHTLLDYFPALQFHSMFSVGRNVFDVMSRYLFKFKKVYDKIFSTMLLVAEKISQFIQECGNKECMQSVVLNYLQDEHIHYKLLWVVVYMIITLFLLYSSYVSNKAIMFSCVYVIKFAVQAVSSLLGYIFHKCKNSLNSKSEMAETGSYCAFDENKVNISEDKYNAVTETSERKVNQLRRIMKLENKLEELKGRNMVDFLEISQKRAELTETEEHVDGRNFVDIE